MKKLIVIFCSITMILLTGCGKDTVPAIAEITTSSGTAIVFTSLNGAGYTYSGAQRAEANELRLELSDGETATIHFYCDKCEHDENESITAPFAKMFSCECPEEMDDSGNAREYIAITAGVTDNK